ncbi:hypothetical protein BU25DRAFT_331677 [Macroventuria anomochaeta]|uniref:Uncharacterized protein n=1 Tax=Macroventuria anomochaeta TaxID=301207 RepID=A0ACB6SDB9_9PLEO|nr:uncharacterized protein BU25DRAFT_331677 [Macroventuria anomochaeta]KAF2632206.1 hypothetical protein BU25DRAFT_331677 [Macroventuria anomochaeta]
MVLQDIENQALDSFTDNPNPSDNDPYASPSSPTLANGERFDASNMPRPIPLVGPLIGFSERALRFKADTTLKFAEKKLGRTLHPEEAQALAFHIYKLEKSKSYYSAGGAAGGVYRWYATMNTYQYPFYKPKIESIDPNKFGPIKGPAANLARQTWRFGLYALVAGQMGNIIGQLIAQPIAAYETSVDPKLEEFGREIKAASGRDEKANNERGRMIEERRKEFEARRRQEGTGGMTPPHGGRGERRQAPPIAGDDDDMSPTAGNEAWGSSNSSGSWGDFANEEQPRPQPERQSVDVRARRLPPYQSTQPSPTSSSSPFDDDTSPTGGLFQSETTSQTAQQPASRPGESSWDRLRRGAGNASPQGASQADRIQRFATSRQSSSGAEESTVGDNFTFVKGKDARDAEREKAQREFDERLERERRGGDFNEGSGKRW